MTTETKPATGRYLAVLTVGALGVVYGDIGTSPLYALKECFAGTHPVAPTRENVLGVLSLIFWSLLLIVSLKYLTFVLRATNRGEGGILALMALAFPKHAPGAGRRRALLVGLGVFGAALLYGDGMITPAISVLSAMEGLKVSAPPNPSGFSLEATPSSQTIIAGQGAAYILRLATNSNFSGAVELACSGLPRDASGNFHPPTLMASDSARLTVQTSTNTSPGSFEVTITGMSAKGNETAKVELTVRSGTSVPADFREDTGDVKGASTNPGASSRSAFEPFIIPLAILTLIGLFAAQSHGTGKVGSVFGPVMVVWFLALAALGIRGIVQAPEVLRALNPWYGLVFLVSIGWEGFVILGAVFLAVTGAEALYADVGHFGTRPIRLAWFLLVLPALFLNYLGQGALVLHDKTTIDNPFYRLAPPWALYPLVVLATAATVIASQALISGAFSLTIQAIQLGYLPRMAVKHTSSRERGQIYMPHINWALMVACVGLVLGFGSSTNMASAYGIAVTLTMLSTTVLFYFASRRLWHWSPVQAGAICGLFLLVETVFFAANLLKVVNGGWFPLVMGSLIFLLMATWKKGRQLVWNKLRPASMPLEMFLESLARSDKVQRVPGTALFMTANPEGTPIALLHNLKHNKVLHERNIILTILTDEVPQVTPDKRLVLEKLGEGFHRMIAHYGFMEEPSVPELLGRAKPEGQAIDLNMVSFFLSRETIVPNSSVAMTRWRQWVFSLMSRNAQSASSFYRIPANRVVELGMQVEI